MTQLGAAKILRTDIASGLGEVVDVRVTYVDENTVSYVFDGKERTCARERFERACERAAKSGQAKVLQKARDQRRAG